MTQTNHEVQDFEAQVVERSRQVPVLVDFWAPWCGPCRVLGPVLERLAAQAAGRWELVKVNTEENEELAAGFSIASIPAVKLFVDGKVVDQFVGALPESEIRRFLERALPSPHAAELNQAAHLLQEGASAEAAEILEGIVQADPGNAAARIWLAQALLSSAPERVDSILQPVGADSESADKAQALRVLARVSQLPARPDDLPSGPLRARYFAGASAVQAADWATALAEFIAVLERDKAYDSGGAKEACRAIFDLLGRDHPLAREFLRPFSSALHS